MILTLKRLYTLSSWITLDRLNGTFKCPSISVIFEFKPGLVTVSTHLHLQKFTNYHGFVFFVFLLCFWFWLHALLCLFCLFNTDSSVFFPLLSPFLLVVCLSPSVCQCCLRLTYFLFISQTFHLSSSLPFHLACSSSGHQCVCLYIVCLPCTRCQFTVCVISPVKFPPLSPVSSHSRMTRLLFWLHVHLLVFPLKP